MKPTKSDHVSDEALAKLGLSRETNLVMDLEGNFFAGDQPIAHPGIAAGFSRWIERTDAGRYVLRNDLHYVYLEVQGAPLHARRARAEGAGVVLELRGGVEEPLRPETLFRDAEGVLYAMGRDGTWTVRLSARAALDLEPLLTLNEADVPCLLLDQTRFEIPLRTPSFEDSA